MRRWLGAGILAAVLLAIGVALVSTDIAGHQMDVRPQWDPHRQVSQEQQQALKFTLLALVILGFFFLATLWSIGYGVSLVWRALRRWAERNWP